MKFLKYSFVLFLLLTLLNNVSNTAILRKSALKIALEFVKAGKNGDFKKLAELCCRPGGPYTTPENVRNLDLGELGFIEKLVREENSEIDPDNLKLVVARSSVSGKLEFKCFYIFKTPANYKIYLRSGNPLFPYPTGKEAQLSYTLEFYLLNYTGFNNNYLKKRFEEILKHLNEEEREIAINVFRHAYPKLATDLIKSGIIKGEIVSFLLPEADQKRALIEITTIGTAIADFVNDNGYAPKVNGTYDDKSEFYKSLTPFYIKKLPIKDPWGNNYRVYTGRACVGKYGITISESDDFIVTSYGANGLIEEYWKYDPRNPKAGLTMMETMDNFDNDLVMWNGSLIRGPKK